MSIELTPPTPVKTIEKEQSSGMVKLDESILQELSSQVDEFINGLIENPETSDEFKERSDLIHQIGSKEINESTSISGRLLSRPVNAMETGVFDGSSSVSKALLELRQVVEDLDPSQYGDLLSIRKLLGFIPLTSKLKVYFRKYQSSQTHIDAIINSLNHGKDELLKDNAAVEEDRQSLWNIIESLEKFCFMGTQLSQDLELKAASLEITNPGKVKIIKEQVLFYVKQRTIDLQTQLAVTIQGYLALDMIKKNNLELVKGIDRATTTTVSALRTAVTVAQALANERLVLDQINALNDTTGSIIESTSNALKNNASEIHKHSSNSTIELDKLKNAFSNIYETIDMIDNYKLEALKSMEETTNELSKEIEKSKTYLKAAQQS